MTKKLEAFRTFHPRTFGIVSSFVLRISKFPLGRHRILRAEWHPRHATEQSRRRQPDSFRETVRAHCFFGIDRARRPEPAPDEMAAERLEDEPVTADDDRIVGDDGDLCPRWLGPIANRRDGQGHRGDLHNQNLVPPQGLPQCGQTAPPSMRFFLQLGHTTSFTFGRVTRWTMSPTTGTSQPRMVTS